MVLPAIALLVSPALADRGAGRFEGPDHTEVDLLRVAPDGPRIYVQAEYPDGSRGLFLVDTGANVSLLSESAAERLGLSIDAGFGSVVGLGGTARMDRAVVPSLRFGDVVVPEVEVAVGVPGMSPTAGAMELDGLLGNNVWSRFTLEIDYPADTLVLHRPGTVKIKRNAGPLVYDGSHVFAPVEVRTARAPDVTHAVVLRVDTGAGDLSLCGKVAEAFDAGWSEGLEPILGLGASETLPPFRNLQTTRHLELAEVRLAGKRIPDVTSARWMSFRGDAGCPDDMRGLAGHHLLSGHRVLFDYQGGHLQLSRSHRKARSLDGHAVVLAQEQATGGTPERALYRALLALQLDQLDLAEEELRIASEVDATRDEALVLLARVDRFRGRPVDALDRLLSLAPGQLVDHEEIVGTVNGLLFESRSDEALAVAREAVASRPEAGWAWVALADVLLVRGEVTEAEDAILQAVAMEGYPDAHLLRRARIALASGDRLASMAHVRRLLHLYPMGGEFLWFYAMLVEEVGESVDVAGQPPAEA
ncbi:MAG: aspartyl protease family protein [Myxococcales bacterium]|nr:aspartyl protease family protein [Myxococcales bacterium]